MSVTVVGTVEGGKAPTKIKTDLKKPIINLACHPRLPVLICSFDSAKGTFEFISDYESMLDLFICHLNPSAMRRLAQKLEDGSADPELRRYYERILRVLSTGWTQGIFANFAAESMVPKGPE